MLPARNKRSSLFHKRLKMFYYSKTMKNHLKNRINVYFF